MHAGGAPQPALQVPYSDGAGLIGRVDFAWPAFRVVGEADGDAKYLDANLRGGRSAERVVLDEKAAAGLPVDHRTTWSECCA
jgi:hypothetical protein